MQVYKSYNVLLVYVLPPLFSPHRQIEKQVWTEDVKGISQRDSYHYFQGYGVMTNEKKDPGNKQSAING